MKTFAFAALAGIAAASIPTVASAADFSFVGSFAKDNGKAGFTFTLGTAGTVEFVSLGYAGGVNSAGASIAAGGFDGVLSVYDVSGFNIGTGDDGTVVDPITTFARDPLLSLTLAAGSYSVYLTQYDNFGPASLGLPFAFDDQPDFRGGFVDFDGFKRTGNWALDIRGVSVAAPIPDASTWALLIVGFGAVGVAARRRRRVTVTFA